MSLGMLRRQAEQGVNVVCATSHFYAHEEPPEAFCKRRAAALAHLRSAMPPDAPRILAASETAFLRASAARRRWKCCALKTPGR